MKKLSTATAHGIDKLQTHQLTIGLDLGDRSSYYCVLDEAGNIVLEEKVATTPKALGTRFAAMPRSRIALETAEYESGESERAQSGTATGAGAVAGRNRIAERADPQVQRTHRAAGPGKLSAGGAAEAGERRGHTDRVDLPADGGGRASFPQESRCGLLSGTAARKKKLGTEPAAAAHQQAR